MLSCETLHFELHIDIPLAQQPQSSDGEPDLLQGELGWDWKERERWEAMLAQGSNMAFKKQQWRKVVESMGENQGIDVDKCLNGGLPTISPTDYMPHDSLLGTETESESPSAFSGDILPKDTNLDALTSGCHSKVLFGHGGLGIQDNAFEGDNALDYASFFRAASLKVQSNN